MMNVALSILSQSLTWHFLAKSLESTTGITFSFFTAFQVITFFSERSGKNFDHFINALSINLWCWENISDAPSYGMACTSTKNWMYIHKYSIVHHINNEPL